MGAGKPREPGCLNRMWENGEKIPGFGAFQQQGVGKSQLTGENSMFVHSWHTQGITLGFLGWELGIPGGNSGSFPYLADVGHLPGFVGVLHVLQEERLTLKCPLADLALGCTKKQGKTSKSWEKCGS